MFVQENWERFLPHFKKRNIQRKKTKILKKPKSKSLFPPEQVGENVVSCALAPVQFFFVVNRHREKRIS